MSFNIIICRTFCYNIANCTTYLPRNMYKERIIYWTRHILCRSLSSRSLCLASLGAQSIRTLNRTHSQYNLQTSILFGAIHPHHHLRKTFPFGKYAWYAYGLLTVARSYFDMSPNSKQPICDFMPNFFLYIDYCVFIWLIPMVILAFSLLWNCKSNVSTTAVATDPFPLWRIFFCHTRIFAFVTWK